MSDREIPAGKVPPEVLGRLLASVSASDLLLGPELGEDAAAIELDADVLVVASDPITLTGADVGRHCVVVNANDVAVTGALPRWFLATVLLPPGSTVSELDALFAGMRDECDRLGIALVGGHTEVTDAVRAPVVGGTMLGVPHAGRIVRSGGARPGDAVVQIGPVPVEGALVLASDDVAGVDAAVLAAARNALTQPGISVVDAALAATELGATAMHDPTEGGLAAGLCELAVASGCALNVDRSRVVWFEPGRALCAALGADPWGTLASGCVIATFSSAEAADELDARGFRVSVLGEVRAGRGVYDESGAAIVPPVRDEVARLRETN
jgi:hydrogenase expression/formation protein HypE